MELFYKYYNMVYWYCNFISNILRSFLVSYNLFLIWCVCLPWPVTWQQLGIFVRLIWLFFYLIYYMYGLQVDWMHGKNNLSQFCYLHFEACIIFVVSYCCAVFYSCIHLPVCAQHIPIHLRWHLLMKYLALHDHASCICWGLISWL